MGIRTGQQFIDSLRDDRKLFIDGRLVRDVTAYGPMKGVIKTIAGLYDQQHDPQYGELLTFISPTSGERVSKTYLEARTAAEFAELSACFHARTLSTFGLMGRLTDFMSGFLMDQASGLDAIGKHEAAAKARSLVEHCRENDLQVTHALIDPQSDRSRHDASSESVHVVERCPDGIVVSGCRMLSTLAPVANECYIGPFFPRKAGEEDYALAFLLPLSAPGLSILARESFDRGEDRHQGSFDRPLTSRFDEGDAILVFDKVFVPADRLIVNGDIDAYNGMMQAGVGYTTIQATTRSTMKLRFLTGLATAIARANGRDKTPRFQTAIGELVALVNVAEAIRAGVVGEGIAKVEAFAAGRQTLGGDGLGQPRVQGGTGMAALNFFYPYATGKAAEVLRFAAGSGALAMTEADYNNPDVGPLLDRWLIGPGIDARSRMRLMKMAWDMTGTEFGSRAALYERLYSGDPERNAMLWFRHPIASECEDMVGRLLAA
ncbi:4-hydroxyphenylacetate 3-hydroxylase N-terminal domain-containing protein [Thauera sinica]|uniref:4-hydroxyphenylacetate 3-hydroxylase N-terminal domain-containing protein n=1 Tax=Thauera sinica TaxID=2665146 RepID=A0ABW1AY21_9RHOO|nr:4-hydroxyphenylacetate 3-hydroxylase N-terminal domain-containing protein [Thauera sp. K11]ATE58647.1 4-hydroxyphenylacetate 3-hydroxylase [Thauera sp. K11]